jgi:adenosylhomocysteine nucleosidase
MTGVGPVEAGVRLGAELSWLKSERTMPDLVVSLGSAGSRTLGVVVSALGQSVRMCDPNPRFTHAGSTDPAACPFPW